MRKLYSRFSQLFDNPLWLPYYFRSLYWRTYNFSWANHIATFENPIAKVSILGSSVGYLIFLNDYMVEHLGFEYVTSGAASLFGLDLRIKLQLLYFGFMLIAFARAIYLYSRPWVIRNGPSEEKFVDYGLKNLTYGDFARLHRDIRENQHRTLYGKYYDDHWDAFAEDATWKDAGNTKRLDPKELLTSRQNVDFSQAKSRHEDLLRSILRDRYAEYSARNKPALLLALAVAFLGYSLFLLPNLDLAITIVSSTFTDWNR